jgi:hypothetical protein
MPLYTADSANEITCFERHPQHSGISLRARAPEEAQPHFTATHNKQNKALTANKLPP